MTLAYGQLPDTIGTRQPQPQMCCTNEDCDAFLALYSAERGDYWAVTDVTPVVCSFCGWPMHLARQVTTIELLEPEGGDK
jgi:hypothetical protein